MLSFQDLDVVFSRRHLVSFLSLIYGFCAQKVVTYQSIPGHYQTQGSLGLEPLAHGALSGVPICSSLVYSKTNSNDVWNRLFHHQSMN